MDRTLIALIALMALLLLAQGSVPSPPATAPRETIAPPSLAIATVAPEIDVVVQTATAAPAPTPRDIADARVIVERLGIDLPLVWGDVARDVPRDGYAGATPERVALVFPGSALPGTGGNTYIYSHARTGMFLTLWQTRRGDLVVLRWPDTSRQYLVSEIHPRIDPSDTTWLDARGPERLTLQTSTGPRASDPRFIVIATPFEADS